MESIMKKIHGSNLDARTIARQGASKFMHMDTGMPHDNPLTAHGRKVMGSMQETYGAKKAKQVFYASINKGKKGSGKWHK